MNHSTHTVALRCSIFCQSRSEGCDVNGSEIPLLHTSIGATHGQTSVLSHLSTASTACTWMSNINCSHRRHYNYEHVYLQLCYICTLHHHWIPSMRTCLRLPQTWLLRCELPHKSHLKKLLNTFIIFLHIYKSQFLIPPLPNQFLTYYLLPELKSLSTFQLPDLPAKHTTKAEV